MPAVMMALMSVVAPRKIIADLPRTIIGHDDATAGRRRRNGGIIVVIGVIVIIGVVVPNTADEDAPEVVPVGEPMAAKMGAVADIRRPSVDRAAMIAHAAAMKAATTVSAMSTMAAADFDRQSIGCDPVRGHGAWIDQR